MSRAATSVSPPPDPVDEPVSELVSEPSSEIEERVEHKGAQRDHLTLKDMVRGARTTARAVRFYEEQGLISTIGRSRGGHRLFGAGELDKLQLVLELRTCGFSIEEIREILRAKSRFSDVRDSAQAIQRMLGEHVAELQRKIQVIERLGREFHSTIDVLSRCARCTDPRGPTACQSCDLPAAVSLPESFCHIWAVPRTKPSSGSSG